MFQKINLFIDQSDFFTKKIFTKNLYAQYLVRRNQSKNFSSGLLLDNAFTYNPLKKMASFLHAKELGASINLEPFHFQNKLNKNIRFTLAYPKLSAPLTNQIEYLGSILNTTQNQLAFISLAYPKKGGFAAFSHSGLLGFMPIREYTASLTNIKFVNCTADFNLSDCFSKSSLSWFLVKFRQIKINGMKKFSRKNSFKVNIVFFNYDEK